MENDNLKVIAKGQWLDIYKDKNGNVVGVSSGTIENPEFKDNLAMDNSAIAAASLFKGEVGYLGVKYWAVGIANTNPSSQTLIKLENEVFRKEILPENIQFMTEAGEISATPTNIIEMNLVFESDEGNVNVGAGERWLEFAIFGGNASATKDSGLILNRVVHNEIPKDSGLAVERKMRFTYVKPSA
jgi:hypothetical protein